MRSIGIGAGSSLWSQTISTAGEAVDDSSVQAGPQNGITMYGAAASGTVYYGAADGLVYGYSSANCYVCSNSKFERIFSKFLILENIFLTFREKSFSENFKIALAKSQETGDLGYLVP